ncbi:MAG: BCCT family transporter, partial [Nocardioidaceae bacterium]|nr:BCCT family transporter [Nocardioidaceae bacterium]
GIPRFRGDQPGSDAEAARSAMDTTFLHWGLHAWAIYVVVGLAIAYSVHRKGNPISIRWALEPLLGHRVRGYLGDVIDIIAVLGTLFGVATSLGLGVSQVSAGFVYLDWIDPNDQGVAPTALKVVLIIVITACALASVVSGVDKGIKWLSNINLGFAAGLMILVLVAGPTVFLLSDFITSVGSYLRNFFELSFDALPFQGAQTGADGVNQYDGGAWVSWWTTFYWGWWISWAPFVGVFIARISKGRTVREFVIGVLLVPTTVTFLWFSVLGGTAIHRELFGDGGLVTPVLDASGKVIEGSRAVSTDTALFAMLDGLPLGSFTIVASILAIFLIVIFFVTSSDSGSFVVDMLASGGNPNPPVWSRAFWASMEGMIAAVLLLAGGGGLGALQTMAILLAVPFSVVMVLMCFSIAKALLAERRDWVHRQRKWLAEQVANEIQDSALLADSAAAPESVTSHGGGFRGPGESDPR